MSPLAHARLGRSELSVSRVALGSWRTFEAHAARGRRRGDARRASGWNRDEVVVANKLWWEFWPEQDAAGELVHAGKLRARGLLNWPADLLAEAGRSAERQGVAPPAAVQLPYSLVRRSPVEDPETAAALTTSGAGIVASATLAAGALTGKYANAEAAGRIASHRNDPALAAALAAGEELVSLAADLETTPASLAIAFALSHPNVASVLFGATSSSQIAENVAALDRLTDDQRAALEQVGVTSGPGPS